MSRTFRMLILGFLILLLTACSSGNAQTSASTASPSLSTPTATPTQPSVPSGTILFQSDWSRGLAGWGGSPGWKIVNGMPQSDLSQDNALTIPYHLTIPNYAIEFRFQILRVPRNGGSFFVRASKTPDKTGYTAGILNLLSPAPHSEFANPEIVIYLDPLDAIENPEAARPSDYEPGTFWHTFRVEVQDQVANFLADGNGKGRAVSSQAAHMSNGPLQLICTGAIVRVASVRLIAL